MIHDFYMFYRMRTKQTFEVKENTKEGHLFKQYYVKVTIEDNKKSFNIATIIGAQGYTPDQAIEEIMDILRKMPSVCNIKTATKEELETWNKL